MLESLITDRALEAMVVGYAEDGIPFVNLYSIQGTEVGQRTEAISLAPLISVNLKYEAYLYLENKLGNIITCCYTNQISMSFLFLLPEGKMTAEISCMSLRIFHGVVDFSCSYMR